MLVQYSIHLPQSICVLLYLFMPKNKNAFLRYRIINDILKGGIKIEWKEFVQKIGERLNEEANTQSETISERTVEYDLNIMRKDQPTGFNAPIKRSKGFIFYTNSSYDVFGSYIAESELSKLAQLFRMYQSYWEFPFTEEINKFINKFYNQSYREKEISEIIEFDLIRNSKGISLLNKILELLIIKKQVIVNYKSFTETRIELFADPLFVKEYNNRWYLIIYVRDIDQYFNLALDRIENIRALNTNSNTELRNHIKNLYKNNIGASIPNIEFKEPQLIRLKIHKTYSHYLRTKPLHKSQKEEIFENHSIFQYRIYNSIELKREIFRMGSDCEVLEPIELRDELIEEARKLQNLYL